MQFWYLVATTQTIKPHLNHSPYVVVLDPTASVHLCAIGEHHCTSCSLVGSLHYQCGIIIIHVFILQRLYKL